MTTNTQHKFSILHTTDLHGDFNRNRQDLIRDLREERSNTLLFDCGDALPVGNLNPGIGAGPILERMSKSGYSAMAMGNRETHLWWPFLGRKLAGAQFPVVSTNIRNRRRRLPILSYATFVASGIRVVVLGLTPQMVTPGTFAARFSSVSFDDPLTAAKKAALKRAPQADMMICLSHLGLEFDRTLAKEVPSIDLILGGHDHSPGLPEGELIGKTFLARSSPFGADIGEVMVEAEPDGKAFKFSFSARLIPMDEPVEEDDEDDGE